MLFRFFSFVLFSFLLSQLRHSAAMSDNMMLAACQTGYPHEDAEMFEEASHPSRLLDALNRLRLNSTLCDVMVCCEGQEFPGHRSVLASFSPYFEAMFTSGMVESTQERVSIGGVEPQMVGLIVNYAYTSKVSICTDNVQDLLAAADLLEVRDVRKACCDYMRRHLDIENCFEVYCCADAYACGTLKNHSMDYILEHFPVLYKKKEFLCLPVERLTELLASDHLNAPQEDMVFEAAILWLNHHPDHKQTFDKVLENIRLPLIGPSYLPTVMEALDVMKESQGCQGFLSEATAIISGDQHHLLSYCNTARPRRTTVATVILLLGSKADGLLAVKSVSPRTKEWKWKSIGSCSAKGEQMVVPDVCELTLDPNTADSLLSLSKNNRKVTCDGVDYQYPDHPDRFKTSLQVMCRESLTGRCYWQVEWSGMVYIAVTYRGINRQGSGSEFGDNDQSWSLECDGGDNRYTVRHNMNRTVLPIRPSSRSGRVSVYVDCPSGTVSFYTVSSSDTVTHLYTFRTTFTEPLYAGFRCWWPIGSSVSLCQI